LFSWLSRVPPSPLPVYPSGEVFPSPILFSALFLISKRWMLVLLEVHATRFIVGWNIMLVMKALPDPLLSSYNYSPSSVLNILISVPLTEAVARRVPSEFKVRAPISYSWA